MHSLIVGMTEMGKSTLAKKLAESFLRSGWPVLVLDAMGDYTYPNTKFFTDPAEFDRVLRVSRRCMVFLEEAQIYLPEHNREYLHWFQYGRHFGHSLHLVTQRPTRVAVTARDQCGNCYAFRMSRSSAKIIADEWDRPEVYEVTKYRPGQFIVLPRAGQVQRRQLW